jgi:HSP20 family protein
MPLRYRRFSAQFVRTPLAIGPVETDPFWGVRLLTVAPTHWRPALDACESENGLTITLDVAGLDEERTAIELFADALVIDGERTTEPCPPGGRYHRAEIRQGPFRAEVPLPFPVDADDVSATYERGLLRVELTRARPTRIEPER